MRRSRLRFRIKRKTVYLKKILLEDPVQSTPDGSNFFIFSGRYVRDTMSNKVFFSTFFGSIFTQLRPGHRPPEVVFLNFSGNIVPGSFAKTSSKNRFWALFVNFCLSIYVRLGKNKKVRLGSYMWVRDYLKRSCDDLDAPNYINSNPWSYWEIFWESTHRLLESG